MRSDREVSIEATLTCPHSAYIAVNCSLKISKLLFSSQFKLFLTAMKNPLDLNNLPEDHSDRWREGKQVLEETETAFNDSSSMGDKNEEKKDEERKRKCGANEGKEACGKVYECRFCSLKFCKSQALGGHMNRHRQERETETLNRARQLVYGNESIAVPGLNMGLRDQNLIGAPAIPAGNIHQRTSIEPALPYPSIFNRPPPAASTAIFTPSQTSLYRHPSNSRHLQFPAQFTPPMNDYLIGHVLPGYTHYHQQENSANYRKTTQGVVAGDSNSGGFTSVRPPPLSHGDLPTAGETISLYNQVDGTTGWSSYPDEHQQQQSPRTMHHRFQDNF